MVDQETPAEGTAVLSDEERERATRAMDVLPDGRIDHRDHERDDHPSGYGWTCLWCEVGWTIPYDTEGRPIPEDWRERPYSEVLALCGMSLAARAALPGTADTGAREAVERDDAVLDYGPLGALVREISGLIDSTYPADLDREAHLLRRVMKVSEETGEVTEALFGALGENARKGRTHTMHDVRRELLDVALAALAAICHFDDDDPIDYLGEHTATVHTRLRAALAATPDGHQHAAEES